MKNFKEFLNEMVDGGGGFGGGGGDLQPGNPPTNIPEPLNPHPPGGYPFPHPPGVPAWWYRPGSGGFNNDGEQPGTPPGPKDPRWKEWYKQWNQNNPPPTRQPGESDRDYQRRRDDYQRLLQMYKIWREQYFRWWQETWGRGRHANPMG